LYSIKIIVSIWKVPINHENTTCVCVGLAKKMYSLIAFNFLFTVFKIDFHFIPESILIHIKLLYFTEQ